MRDTNLPWERQREKMPAARNARLTATVGLIFLYFARRPGEAEAHLSDLRDRLVRAGPAVFAIVSAAVGVFLIVDGVAGIVGS
jgi:hypothetical protein